MSALFAAACHDEEGIEVASLEIEGAHAIAEKTLLSVLATRASSRLPWGPKRYFDRAAFEADLKRIRAYYLDHGYPSARVDSFAVDLDEDQTRARLRVVVVEGEPLRVESVQLWGFETLRPRQHEAILREFPIKAGDVYDRVRAKSARADVARDLHDRGFPYARVELLEAEGRAPGRLVLTLAADPGPRARISEVVINGNTSVSEEVIRRTLSFRPGDVFRLNQLQGSQRRLYELELFQYANVEPRLETEPGADVPVRVTVAEGDHRRLRFAAGYGSEEKARVQANWQHVNFFGGARTARLSAKWSALERGISGDVTQPYVFSPVTSLAGNVSWWLTNEPAYRLDSRGGRVSLARHVGRGRVGRRFSDTTITGSLIHQFEDYTVSDEALDDPTFRDELIALGLDPVTGRGRGTLAAWALDARRSTTPNLLDGRRGYVATLHLEHAVPLLGGDFRYFEVLVEGRHYTNLGRVGVWANRVRVGTLSSALERGLPFFKRYFLGGSNSLRGWGRFEVAPLSPGGLPIGGRSLLEMSTELRVQLRGNLGLVAFVDAGNVWERPWDQDLGELRYSAGPGLRYATPIGPLRVDLGYQLNPIDGLLINGEPQQRQWRLHFSIGHAF